MSYSDVKRQNMIAGVAKVLMEATDVERPFVEEAVIRTGLFWRCPKCGDMNPSDGETCNGCSYESA